jgi:hypothetical protein
VKKILISGCVTAVLFTGCAGGVAQLAQSGMAQEMMKSSLSSSTTDKVSTVKSKNTNCIARSSGGQVGMMGMMSKLVVNQLIESTLKSMDGMKDVKLPNTFLNTCQADSGLKSITLLSNKWNQNLAQINVKILEAMEQTKEVRENLAISRDLNTSKDSAIVSVGVVEQTEKIAELSKSAKIIDRKKISEAQGMFGQFMLMSGVIAGWDKEVASFSQDNLPWAIKNVSGIKVAFGQLTTIIEVLPLGKLALEKLFENNNLKLDKKSASRAAKSMRKDDSKVIKDASNLDDDSSYS